MSKAPRKPADRRASNNTASRASRRQPSVARNADLLADEKLIALIEDHAKAATDATKTAGEGSISALRRYYHIGEALLEQKSLGKFRKPNTSIKHFCNTALSGIIGDTNPYGMCGLCMTLAKPGKKKAGIWETLLDHVEAMASAGTPVGPMGINAAMSLARKLMRGEADAKAAPNPSKVGSIKKKFAELEAELEAMRQRAEEAETKLVNAVPVTSPPETEATDTVAEMEERLKDAASTIESLRFALSEDERKMERLQTIAARPSNAITAMVRVLAMAEDTTGNGNYLGVYGRRILGIEDEYPDTKAEVMRAFRKACIDFGWHPDHGGSGPMMRAVTRAKDELLANLSRTKQAA